MPELDLRMLTLKDSAMELPSHQVKGLMAQMKEMSAVLGDQVWKQQ